MWRQLAVKYAIKGHLKVYFLKHDLSFLHKIASRIFKGIGSVVASLDLAC
jgi:hypothetical protein